MTSITLTNLITNGSFESSDMSDWHSITGGNYVAPTRTSGTSFSKFGTYSEKFDITVGKLSHFYQHVSIIAGHKYYFSSWIREIVDSGTARNTINIRLGQGSVDKYTNGISTTGSYQFADAFDYCVPTASTTSTIGFDIVNPSATLPSEIYLDGIVVIDVTASFGSGNEPDIDVIRNIVRNIGWFDTTSTVTLPTQYEEGKASFTNSITNGSSGGDTTGWTVTGTAIGSDTTNPVYGTYDFKLTSFYGGIASQLSQAVSTTSGHIYYAAIRLMKAYDIDSTVASFGGTYLSGSSSTSSMGRSSTTFTATASSTSFVMYHLCYNSGVVSSDAYFDGAIVIDLTSSFGAGFEPSSDFMDGLIEWRMAGWFDSGLVKCYTATSIIYVENIIDNGSFEAALSGTWTTTGTVILDATHHEYGSRCVDVDVYGGVPSDIRSCITQDIYMYSGHKYFITNVGLDIYAGSGSRECSTYIDSTTIYSITLTPMGGWTRGSGIYTATSTGTKTLKIENSSVGSTIHIYVGIDGVMVIDLTDVFGSGNEPASTDIEPILDWLGGWWDDGISNAAQIVKDDFKNILYRQSFENLDSMDVWTATIGTNMTSSLITAPINSYDVFQAKGLRQLYLTSTAASSQTMGEVTQAFTSSQWGYVSGTNYLYASAIGKKEEYALFIPLVGIHGGTSGGNNADITSSMSRCSCLHSTTYNETITYKIDYEGNEDYAEWAVFDGMVFLRLNDIFDSYASVVTNTMVDCIIDAFGESLPTQIGPPSTLTAESARMTDTPCFFKNTETWSSVTDAVLYYLYKSTTESGTYELVIATTSLSYEINDLLPLATAYYKVAASDVEGTISALTDSEHVTNVTNNPSVTTPSAATESTGIVLLTSTFYATAPPSAGGVSLPLYSYNIYRYRCATPSGTYTQDGNLVTVVSSSTSITHSDTGTATHGTALVPDYYYKYAVQSTTCAGYYVSGYSLGAYVATSTQPQYPTSIGGTPSSYGTTYPSAVAAIDMTWTPDSTVSPLAPITSYTVDRYATAGTTILDTMTGISSSATGILYHSTVNMALGTLYRFKVSCLSKWGSSTSGYTTSWYSGNVPIATTFNTGNCYPYIEGTTSSVHLEWVPHDISSITVMRGSVLDTVNPVYNIYRKTGAGSYALVDTRTYNVSFDDWDDETGTLAMNTTYDFKVCLLSNLGDSLGCEISETTYGPPTMPVEYAGIRNKSYFNVPYVKIAWIKPTEPVNPITGYNIYKSETYNTFPVDPTYIVISGNTVFDTDIDASTKYYYRIRSYNGLGEGPDSD